jgi:hypothetical protein
MWLRHTALFTLIAGMKPHSLGTTEAAEVLGSTSDQALTEAECLLPPACKAVLTDKCLQEEHRELSG